AAAVESAGLLVDDNGRPNRDTHKLQHLVTEQVEKHARSSLDARIRRLPADDMRLVAWLNTNKTSTVWLNALPTEDDRLTCNEFAEVAARYYGMPSPACAQFVGMPLRGRTVDAYGFALASESLPGGGFTCQHDMLKWSIAASAREMGQHVVTEVYGLFAAHIPQEGRKVLKGLPPRKRHGIVPDFLMRLKFLQELTPEEYLLELKVAHLCLTWYQFADVANAGPSATCLAVKRRARAVPREYVAKAQEADQKYCGTAPGTVGPIEQRLRSFEHVVPLVFGAFGESSEGVEVLISALADAGAERHWRRMKASKKEPAQGALAWLLRRRWGMMALRENARLTLDRLAFAGEEGRPGSRSMARFEKRAKARADALAVSMHGPGIGDPRPAVATRWA
ncbi:MAG: hypothetical protein VX000_03190, partial [Myxococcota bacterium]|nr:hypothetical protein [Myxococcota bacterium]